MKADNNRNRSTQRWAVGFSQILKSHSYWGFNYSPVDGGIKVIELQPRSVLKTLGIEVGDTIIQFNKKNKREAAPISFRKIPPGSWAKCRFMRAEKVREIEIRAKSFYAIHCQ